MDSPIFAKRFRGARQPAGHDLLDTYVPDTARMTPSQAILAAGLDYDVVKAPATVHAFGREIVEKDKYGRPTHWLLIRGPMRNDPEPRVFGTCGPDYEVLQNRDLARLLDPLVTERGYRLDALVGLEFGARTLFVFDTGEVAVRGDHFRRYLYLLDGKDGRRAFRAEIGLVREQSQVLYNPASSAVALDLAVLHRTVSDLAVRDSASFLVTVLSQVEHHSEQLVSVLTALSLFPITGDVRKQALEAAYPDPELPKSLRMHFDVESAAYKEASERFRFTQERIRAFREGADTLIEEFERRNEFFEGSLYAILHGIFECADWRGGHNDRSAAREVMFGFRRDEKTRAFAVVLEHALHVASEYTEDHPKFGEAVRILKRLEITR